MSQNNDFEFHAQATEVPLLTEEQAWATLNLAVAILSKPGEAEHSIEHSQFGSMLKKAELAVVVGLQNGTTVCQGMSPEGAEAVAKGVHDVMSAWHLFYDDVLSRVALAIQSLPFNKLVEESSFSKGDPTEEQLAGMSPGSRATLLAQKAALNGPEYEGLNKSTLIIKPCEQVQALLALSSLLLGGAENMALVQAQATRALPPEYSGNPVIALSAQVTACLSQGLQMRVQREDFAGAVITGVAETFKALKRTMMLPTIPMWDQEPGDIYGHILDVADSCVTEHIKEGFEGLTTPGDLTEREQFAREAEAGAEEFIRKAETTNLKPQQAPLEADKPDNMKATSTLFNGTRTIN